jgi:hypothetical protein
MKSAFMFLLLSLGGCTHTQNQASNLRLIAEAEAPSKKYASIDEALAALRVALATADDKIVVKVFNEATPGEPSSIALDGKSKLALIASITSSTVTRSSPGIALDFRSYIVFLGQKHELASDVMLVLSRRKRQITLADVYIKNGMICRGRSYALDRRSMDGEAIGVIKENLIKLSASNATGFWNIIEGQSGGVAPIVVSPPPEAPAPR